MRPSPARCWRISATRRARWPRRRREVRYSLLRWRRLHGRQEPDFPVPFVVGATRSGTTLLRLMLDAHPDLAIPYETHFIPQLIRTARKRGVSCEEVHGVVTG